MALTSARVPRLDRVTGDFPLEAQARKARRTRDHGTPIDVATTVKVVAARAAAEPQDEITLIANKWKMKRGSLIMALHDLQSRVGYVPRESAMKLGRQMGVPAGAHL